MHLGISFSLLSLVSNHAANVIDKCQSSDGKCALEWEEGVTCNCKGWGKRVLLPITRCPAGGLFHFEPHVSPDGPASQLPKPSCCFGLSLPMSITHAIWSTGTTQSFFKEFKCLLSCRNCGVAPGSSPEEISCTQIVHISLLFKTSNLATLCPAIYNEFSAAACIGKVSTEYNL